MTLDFGDSNVRRLPIYLLIDCSESMVGEALDSVNQGLQQLVTDLRNDPMAVETAHLSLITFAGKARQITPLVDIVRFSPPSLSIGPGTSLGAAFELLGQCISREVRKSTATQKGDYKPLVFLLTDGMPTDNWQKGFKKFKTAASVVNIIAVGCGEDADAEILKAVTSNVLLMKNMSPGDFKAFFKWVSTSVSTASVSAGKDGKAVNLSAPPVGVFETAGSVSSSAKHVKTPSQFILSAHCQGSGAGYLMRYRRGSSDDTYQAEKCYRVGNDYFSDAATAPSGQAVDSSKLKGAPACPYCGRPGWAMSKEKSGLICSDRLELGSKQAQVMFVLDRTGSMSGEIEGVKDNIKDFMDFIQSEGLSVEVGLIAFRDLEYGEQPDLLIFNGSPFTKQAAEFKVQVSTLQPDGGGNNPGESSFDAIALACQQPFKEDVTKILVLITDEPPLIPDGRIRSVEDVIRAMNNVQIDQLYIVIPERLNSYYVSLHNAIKGEIFPLGSGGRGGTGFRKVLLDIGRSISVTTRIG